MDHTFLNEPGRDKALAQLGTVVRVVLPLDMAGQLAHPRDERLDLAVGRCAEHRAPAVADIEPVRLVRFAHLFVEQLQELRRLHGRRL